MASVVGVSVGARGGVGAEVYVGDKKFTVGKSVGAVEVGFSVGAFVAASYEVSKGITRITWKRSRNEIRS